MKRLLALLALSLAGLPAFGQLIIGWSGGYGNPQELNRVIYIYNAINRQGLDKEMQPVHWNQGFAGGYRIGDEVFVELLYSRKRSLVHSEFDSSGVAMERQLKVLANSWNFGVGVNYGKVSLGMSFDMGRFKGYGRRGPQSSIGDIDYQKLWVLDDTRMMGISVFKLNLGATAFAELNLGRLGLRGYLQFPFLRNQMEGVDFWLLGDGLNYAEYLEDKFVNAGLMVSIQLGGR